MAASGASATLLIDGKTVSLYPGKIIVEDGESRSIVLNMTRAQNAALVAAMKETAPKV